MVSLAVRASTAVGLFSEALPYSLPESSGDVVLIGTNTLQSIKHSAFNDTDWWRANVGSYGSGCFVPEYSQYGAYVIAGIGGHGQPDWPGASIFDFTDATWTRLDPDGVTPTGGAYAPGDTNGSPHYELTGTQVPAPAHSYRMLVPMVLAGYSGTKGYVGYIGRAGVTTESNGSGSVHALDLDSGVWARVTDEQNPKGGAFEATSLRDAATNRYYYVPTDVPSSQNLAYFDGDELEFAATAGYDWPADGTGYATSALDPDRRLIIKQRGTQLQVLDIDNPATGWQAVTVTGTLPTGTNQWVYADHVSAFYKAEENDPGDTLHKLVMTSDTTATVTTLTLSQALAEYGGGGDPGAGVQAHGSLIYVPLIECLAWFSHGGTGAATDQVALIRP